MPLDVQKTIRERRTEEKKSYLLPCVPDSLCILHRYDTQCPAKHGGTAKSGLAKCKTGWHPRWHMTVFSALSLCVALC